MRTGVSLRTGAGLAREGLHVSASHRVGLAVDAAAADRAAAPAAGKQSQLLCASWDWRGVVWMQTPPASAQQHTRRTPQAHGGARDSSAAALGAGGALGGSRGAGVRARLAGNAVGVACRVARVGGGQAQEQARSDSVWQTSTWCPLLSTPCCFHPVSGMIRVRRNCGTSALNAFAA
jgi:hypothetical protein